MTPLVGSARMYAVSPGAAIAWRALLTEIGRRATLPLDVIDHAPPATLSELWERPDLGCAFMCGWPLARENQASGMNPQAPARPILAAPVPNDPWCGNAPVYRSEFVVAANATFRRIEDTFGTRFAFNALSSHSGANMPRAYLAGLASAAHFSGFVGPLVTPRRCVEAVVAGDAEVTAIDSYAWTLLVRHDPALSGKARILASSGPSPIPPLVGSPALGAEAVRRLRAALLGLEHDPAGRALLDELCLSRFVAVEPADYDSTLALEVLASRIPFAGLAPQ